MYSYWNGSEHLIVNFYYDPYQPCGYCVSTAILQNPKLSSAQLKRPVKTFSHLSCIISAPLSELLLGYLSD